MKSILNNDSSNTFQPPSTDRKGRIRSGKYCHRIKTVGDPIGKSYITKYVVDIEVSPVITKVRIYADEQGYYAIPKEYRSDMVYGENIKAMAVALNTCA